MTKRPTDSKTSIIEKAIKDRTYRHEKVMGLYETLSITSLVVLKSGFVCAVRNDEPTPATLYPLIINDLIEDDGVEVLMVDTAETVSTQTFTWYTDDPGFEARFQTDPNIASRAKYKLMSLDAAIYAYNTQIVSRLLAQDETVDESMFIVDYVPHMEHVTPRALYAQLTGMTRFAPSVDQFETGVVFHREYMDHLLTKEDMNYQDVLGMSFTLDSYVVMSTGMVCPVSVDNHRRGNRLSPLYYNPQDSSLTENSVPVTTIPFKWCGDSDRNRGSHKGLELAVSAYNAQVESLDHEPTIVDFVFRPDRMTSLWTLAQVEDTAESEYRESLSITYPDVIYAAVQFDDGAVAVVVHNEDYNRMDLLEVRHDGDQTIRTIGTPLVPFTFPHFFDVDSLALAVQVVNYYNQQNNPTVGQIIQRSFSKCPTLK